MQALVYEGNLARVALTKLLGGLSARAYVGPTAPMQLREIPPPELPAPDWVLLRTRLCGLCGSDYKQVFLEGSSDNPMTALISFPQVLGHEVVGVIESVGPAVRARRPGERVVLNPWLSCATRGLPPCEWCARGELAQCRNFATGHLAPGIHTGNSRSAPGGFAPWLPAHESQCIPVPDGVGDEAAVLADPFSVSLHAILHEPPPTSGSALVYGCGTLGLLAIAILRALHPDVGVLAVARFPHQARLAERLGARRVLPHRPTGELIERVAAELGVEVQRPWRGAPMLNGGVDVIFDSVVSCLAIHHVPDACKRALFGRIFAALREGGVFVNADQVSGETPQVEAQQRARWLRRVRELGTPEDVLAAAIERMRHDRPAPLEAQLGWLRDAGFRDAHCAYRSGMFAVFAGAR